MGNSGQEPDLILPCVSKAQPEPGTEQAGTKKVMDDGWMNGWMDDGWMDGGWVDGLEMG